MSTRELRSRESDAARSAGETTLMDLIIAIGEVSKNDACVAPTVAHLVNSGRVRFLGRFRDRDVRIDA